LVPPLLESAPFILHVRDSPVLSQLLSPPSPECFLTLLTSILGDVKDTLVSLTPFPFPLSLSFAHILLTVGSFWLGISYAIFVTMTLDGFLHRRNIQKADPPFDADGSPPPTPFLLFPFLRFFFFSPFPFPCGGRWILPKKIYPGFAISRYGPSRDSLACFKHPPMSFSRHVQDRFGDLAVLFFSLFLFLRLKTL